MSDQWNLKHFKDTDGTLISHAWPGGYPVVYYDKDYSKLCPDCANRLLREWQDAVSAYKAMTDEEERQEQYRTVQMCADTTPRYGDVYYEGPVIQCAECNAGIESAYGDPDAIEPISTSVECGIVTEIYTVEIPSDLSDGADYRFDVAVNILRDKSAVYAMPCTWTLINDDEDTVTVARSYNDNNGDS